MTGSRYIPTERLEQMRAAIRRARDRGKHHDADALCDQLLDLIYPNRWKSHV